MAPRGGDRDRLAAAIAVFARDVPSETVVLIADALEALPANASPHERAGIAVVAPQATVRSMVTSLCESWARDGEHVSPQSVAWALRSADRADAQNRASQSLELVWTGPAPHNATFRRIDQALLELVEGARHTLTIVTFAAYRVAAVRAALEGAAARGVAMRLIVETRDESEGKLGLDVLPALGEAIRRHASVYVWPKAKRPHDERGETGALHAKCAVADDDAVLLSSANLTGHALALNMEMGVLIRGGAMPRQVRAHFDALCDAGVLAAVE